MVSLTINQTISLKLAPLDSFYFFIENILVSIQRGFCFTGNGKGKNKDAPNQENHWRRVACKWKILMGTGKFDLIEFTYRLHILFDPYI